MIALLFGKDVLVAEGLADWHLEYSRAGSMCWHSRKLIQVHPSQQTVAGMVLHEIAHALTPECQAPNCHDWRWGDTFTRLVSTYTTSRNRRHQCLTKN